jgi:hypothetical protein
MSQAENSETSATTRYALLLEVGEAVLIFAVARGLLALVVLLGLAMTIQNPRRDPNTYAWHAFPSSYFWDGWARWDSGWFMTIVEEGYANGPNARKKAAFFPLYPYTTRALARLTADHWSAGLIVSNLGALGGVFFLGRIARDSGFDDEGARRSQWYLLSFPTSFFLSAYYSEGLFLLWSTAATSSYLRRRYLAAGLCGVLACATRHIGLAVFVACVIGAIWRWRRKDSPRLPTVWLLLMPLGTFAFMLILQVQLNDPLAFLSAHGAWGRSALGPHETLWRTLSHIDWSLPRDLINTIDLMDAVSAIAFLVLPCLLFRRTDPALPIMGLLFILVPLASGSVKSLMRCECVSFPGFLALAWCGRSKLADRAILAGLSMLLGVLALQFANWYWVD